MYLAAVLGDSHNKEWCNILTGRPESLRLATVSFSFTSMDLLEVLGLSRPVADCAVCFELYFEEAKGKRASPPCWLLCLCDALVCCCFTALVVSAAVAAQSAAHTACCYREFRR